MIFCILLFPFSFFRPFSSFSGYSFYINHWYTVHHIFIPICFLVEGINIEHILESKNNAIQSLLFELFYLFFLSVSWIVLIVTFFQKDVALPSHGSI